MDYSGRTWLSGSGVASNASADKTIIAAQGSGKVIRILSGHVNVTTAAVGGGGLVALKDGASGNIIWQATADAVGSYPIDFEPFGYPLSDNTLLNLNVSGAATTQATARASIVAMA